METRSHVHEIELFASPAEVFRLLVTPSAIREWWSAARAIVIARTGGVWCAAWGDREDDPDYITAAIIKVYDPPQRLVLSDFDYYAKSGPLPFDASLTTEFRISARGAESVLRVNQTGFPADSVADEFYKGCEVGWRQTFDAIRMYVDAHNV